MQFAFFETALRAQKSYSRLMEPVCKKWDLTHNELDVLLFLANNPEQNRGGRISSGGGACPRGMSPFLYGVWKIVDWLPVGRTGLTAEPSIWR